MTFTQNVLSFNIIKTFVINRERKQENFICLCGVTYKYDHNQIIVLKFFIVFKRLNHQTIKFPCSFFEY